VAELRKAKGRALIICVDTAIRTLHGAGVVPDLVVSIDAGKENFRDFEGIALTHETLVAVPVIYPEIISLFDRVFLTSYGHPLMDWIESFIGEKGYTKVGGSVVTTCFDLTRWLSCNPVIFVGLDLAYTDMKDHTKGAFFIEDSLSRINRFFTLPMKGREAIKEKDICWVDGVDGGKVPTSGEMLSWIRWLESQIRESHMLSGTTYIDATEGGAKIIGTSTMKLCDAIKRYCKAEFPIKRILAESIFSYKGGEIQPLIDGLKRLIISWLRIKKMSREGKRVASNILNTPKDNPSIKFMFSQLAAICKGVFKERELMQVGRWSIEPLLHKAGLNTFERKLPNVELVKKSERFFGSLEALSNEVMTQIQYSIEKLQGGKFDIREKSVLIS
jgi:hypothetical protein